MNKQHISAEFFNYIIRKIAKQFLAAKYKTLWPLVRLIRLKESSSERYFAAVNKW